MDYTNEELEEKGLVEVCNHCNSLHITMESNGDKYCNSCGIVNFTVIVTEDQWVARDRVMNKINC